MATPTSNQAEVFLRELLAVIHKDGGHHTALVGLSKSCIDACAEIAELKKRLDTAEFNLNKERQRWDGHDCYPRDGND